MKINLQIEAEECPYWDYEKHSDTHTCNGCTCLTQGNSLENVEIIGVMVGEDRYCTINSNVNAALIEAVNT